MKMIWLAGILLAIGSTMGGYAQTEPAAAATSPAPELKIGRAEAAITVDGRLDEADWKNAGVIAALAQADPHPGEPTRYPTEVRMLRDERNIYVGVICMDPQPDKISIHTLQRDGDLSGDDALTLVFDTFGDGRTGFFFRVNAAGTRKDALMSSGDLNFDWDGIWEVKTRREADRWVAEFRFPAQTLRFKAESDGWGFNVERQIARDQLRLRWAGITLNASIFNLQRTGRLTGMAGLQQGRGLSVSPFAVVELERGEAVPHTLKGSAGVDITYNLTPQLTSVLTINPDFGEAEVDNRQVNLTRFPLFFPEKRPFFAEGANAFSDPSPFAPFYTRRIGQFRGHAIPIDGGLKILGAIGPLQIALLDVQTRKTAFAPATNLGGGRLVWNLDSHWQAGVKFTRGHPDGIRDNSFTSGDLSYNTAKLFGDKSFYFSLWGARAHGDLPQGARSGGGFSIGYPNDFWEWNAEASQLGDAMIPALGFVPRLGTRSYHLWNSVKPRPDEKGPLGWVRQFYFNTEFNQVVGLDGITQSRDLYLSPLDVFTQKSAHFVAGVSLNYEFTPASFEISPGVVIPAGGYHFNRWRFFAASPNSRPLRLGGSVTIGGFYGGRLSQYNSFVNWAGKAGHLQLSLSLENDFAELPGGNFVLRLMQFKFIYAASPDLSVSSYTQYDTFSRAIGLNNRVRWTIKPGNDLFVVWNRNWLNPPGNGAISLKPQSDEVLIKLRWTFRV